ncbi:MAG TPA: DNA repair protein RadC [Syntrophomonadaceae bacterium]|nr:DNA repair protein RadC [Syntrophomonadaceae bacterium]
MIEEYKLTIKEMPPSMRPREKMLNLGVGSLNESELLAIIIGMGTRKITAIELADNLMKKYGDLRNLKKASIEELKEEKGIGQAKAVQIKAAFELGERVATITYDRIYIKSPEDVKNMVMEEMKYFDREYFRALYLDRKNGVIKMQDISVGGLHSSIVHPREVFKTAVKISAASIILVHNHPSGDPTPSPEDIKITKDLIEAGALMGIPVLDHIIIGDNCYTSLKAKNLV